jgi:hypothetical protein
MHITCSQFWCYGDYFKFVIHVLIGGILFCGNFDVRFLIEKQKEYCKVWRRRHPHGKQFLENLQILYTELKEMVCTESEESNYRL